MTPKDTPDADILIAEIPAAEIPNEGNICFADPAASCTRARRRSGSTIRH